MTLQEAMDYRGENPATLSDKLAVQEGYVRRDPDRGGRCRGGAVRKRRQELMEYIYSLYDSQTSKRRTGAGGKAEKMRKPLQFHRPLKRRGETAPPRGHLFRRKGEDMASLAGLSGIAMPQFRDKMDPEDPRALKNYLYQLTDQLEYVLTNLSSENMNEEFLKKVEK